MGDAKTNKTAAAADASTTTATSSDADQTQTSGVQSKADAPKFYVDGKAVNEEAYFKAAESAYDVNFLRAHPEIRPAISTKKHGE